MTKELYLTGSQEKKNHFTVYWTLEKSRPYTEIGYNTDHCVLNSHQLSNEGGDMRNAVSPLTDREWIISCSLYVVLSKENCPKRQGLDCHAVLKLHQVGMTSVQKIQTSISNISTLYLTHKTKLNLSETQRNKEKRCCYLIQYLTKWKTFQWRLQQSISSLTSLALP